MKKIYNSPRVHIVQITRTSLCNTSVGIEGETTGEARSNFWNGNLFGGEEVEAEEQTTY